MKHRGRILTLFITLLCTLPGPFSQSPALAGPDADRAPHHADLDSCRTALGNAGTGPATPLPDSLRVASWNVMKYRREGAKNLVERLAEHVDFLALQEGLQHVAGETPDLEHRYFAKGYVNEDEQSGVELRSRFRASLSCSLSFREPWLRTPKAVLVTHHALGNLGLLVVTLHAINFTFWITDLRAQFDAVGSLLEAHAGPAIVLGDFNNWNAYRQAVITSFAERHGLRTVPFDPDWRSRHLGVPIDSLLQRGFEPLSTAAIPTNASDHHPIVALLRPLANSAPAAGNRAAGGAPGPAP
jgi:endonuclease/exonuclease/phosphatase (EEP) superfamily protein YafD